MFRSSIIAITLNEPDIKIFPYILLYLMISGLSGVWFKNIPDAENNFYLKFLLRLSAFTFYMRPPPLVKQANGIFRSWICLIAYKVRFIGTWPLTSTPSISDMITGLNGLDFLR